MAKKFELEDFDKQMEEIRKRHRPRAGGSLIERMKETIRLKKPKLPGLGR